MRIVSSIAVMTSLSFLGACASSPPITMSTQGSTMVQSATVTAVRGGLPSESGTVSAGTAGQTAEEVNIRFDNGNERAYIVEHGEKFRAGDKVTVTTTNSGTLIAHQSS